MGKTVLRRWCMAPELCCCQRPYGGAGKRGEHSVGGQAVAAGECRAIPAATRTGGPECGNEKLFAAFAITRDQCGGIDEIIRLDFSVEYTKHALMREAGRQTKTTVLATTERLDESKAGGGIGPPAAKGNALPAPLPVRASQLGKQDDHDAMQRSSLLVGARRDR